MKLFNTRTYIALGLVSIVSTALLAGSFLGLVPDRDAAVQDARIALAESLGAASTAILSGSDQQRLEDVLRFVLKRNEDLRSIGLRSREGRLVLAVGEHARAWGPMDGTRPAANQVQVQLHANGDHWGNLELRFAPLHSPPWGVLATPPIPLLAFCATLCLLGFSVYLSRVLRHLDPSQAIPQRVRSALDSLAEGLLVIDQKQQVVLANEAFVRLAGRRNDELVGTPIGRISWLSAAGEPLDAVEHPWAKALDTGMLQTEVAMKLRDTSGELRSFLVNCSPVLAAGGRPGGVLVSLEDVTQLESSKVALEAAKDEAEAANRAKSDFLANMSHEIRTPMNAILGFTELLRRGYGRGGPESARYLDIIRGSGQHLLALINDILDLSKVEAGHVSVERIACAAHEVVAAVVTELQVKAREKGIGLSITAEMALPSRVRTDPARLRQVVMNVVGNAIKFTENGGVRVRIRHEAGLLVVEVVDTGIGIDPSRIESMFDPFTQADASINRRFGGTGLGLAISRRLARALGGDITATSRPGAGTTMRVSIDPGPLDGVAWVEPAEALADKPQAAQVPAQRWKIPQSRVLVADDMPENRELVALVLADQGLWVEEAENGQEAVRMAAAGEFHLVLMDMQMPVMDGFAATRELRARGFTMPVVALTANVMKGFEAEVLAAGCTAYVPKPIDIDQLLDQVAQLLGGERLLEGAVSAAADPQQEGQVISSPALPAAVALGSPPTAVAPADDDGTPIRSRFESNQRLLAIVRKFPARLAEQLAAAEQAAGVGDHVELAKVAHAIAGSAGTVGFDAFTEPARNLESFAKASDAAGARQLITQLQRMAQRISISQAA